MDDRVIDPHGTEWLTITQACARWPIPEATIRSWIARDKIRTHKIMRTVWLNTTDLLHAEHATRGRYLRQRGNALR